MPSSAPEHAVASLLRQCFITPRCQALQWQHSSGQTTRCRPRNLTRQYSTARCLQRSSTARIGGLQCLAGSNGQQNPTKHNARCYSESVGRAQDSAQEKKQEQIAVLGGGITGLASAHYLAREKPQAKITIYEGSSRMGGWLNSKAVEVEGGSAIFESGPRTLRTGTPSGLVTEELITHLGITHEVLYTRKGDTSEAHNRFIYYPDHLVRMPGPGQLPSSILWSLITEPVFKGLFRGMWHAVEHTPRPEGMQDQSIGDFLERLLGSQDVGDNVASAVLHGIYAGDIYQLSAKSLLPWLWYQETRERSILGLSASDAAQRAYWLTPKDMDLTQSLIDKRDANLEDMLGQASVYTFKGGIGTFSSALEKGLRTNPNVVFKTNEKISNVRYDVERDAVTITNEKNQPPITYNTVISTLSARNLSTITSNTLPSLSHQHSVTVMVVNLYYRDPHVLPEQGFGYLIPRSIPYEQNPEFALGVVFDSSSLLYQQDTAPGTKVTVMLGGHWWDGFSSYPTSEEGLEMAKAVLKRHLNVTDDPEAWDVNLHQECIPQYTVGHDASMRTANEELRAGFRGRLRVAGNSYKGVGLHDCVRSAREVVMGLQQEGMTGLEEFAREKVWKRIVPERVEKEE